MIVPPKLKTAVEAARNVFTEPEMKGFNRVFIMREAGKSEYTVKRPPFDGTEYPCAIVWLDGGVDYLRH